MIRLAIPVVSTYLGIMLMGMEDLLFVGRVSPVSVAAVGLGTSLFAWVMIFGFGLLSALEYTVSTAVGRGQKHEAVEWMVQGTWLALAVSVPGTWLLQISASEVTRWLSVDPEVAQLMRPYLLTLSWSLFPVLAFTAKRLTFQAMGNARPGLYALVLGNVINIALNAWWVPHEGAAGSARATLVGRWFLWIFMIWQWRAQWSRTVRKRWHGARMRELLRIGIPSALQMTFEVGVFATVTAIVSRFSPVQQAAHQVVLNTASMTFMVPLGLGASAAVLVGQSLGQGARREAARRGKAALLLGLSFMAASAVVLMVFRHFISMLYTPDPATIALASQLFLIAAFFQLSDGLQTVLTGVLRGWGKTQVSAVWNLVGHWCIGFPVGLYLGIKRGMEVYGLWIGLSLGLTVVAVGLLWNWLALSRSAFHSSPS